MAASTTAEADTLKAFIPGLVTAICDCIQPVSDQCLAKGLIPQTTHERVLESRGTSKEQARTLILSVQNSTKTDEGCFEVFLDILNEILPYRVKEKLLPEMRKDLAEDLADHSGASMRKALIPASQSTRFMVEDDRLQRIQQQGFLFGKYESSMKKYAHASAEKALYEESLENKTKESGKLRSNLEILKSQSNAQEIDSTVERLSACEMEMAELKERLEKIEGVIQEEDMQARRGKSVIMVGTKITEEQFAAALREKEEEYKRLLKEKEDELQKRVQEEKVAKAQVEDQQQKERELREVVEFDEAYGELLPFNGEWGSIGILLDVPLNIIRKMGDEHMRSSSLHLAAVLEWIRDKGRLPTREKLNEIIKTFINKKTVTGLAYNIK